MREEAKLWSWMHGAFSGVINRTERQGRRPVVVELGTARRNDRTPCRVAAQQQVEKAGILGLQPEVQVKACTRHEDERGAPAPPRAVRQESHARDLGGGAKMLSSRPAPNEP